MDSAGYVGWWIAQGKAITEVLKQEFKMNENKNLIINGVEYAPLKTLTNEVKRPRLIYINNNQVDYANERHKNEGGDTALGLSIYGGPGINTSLYREVREGFIEINEDRLKKHYDILKCHHAIHARIERFDRFLKYLEASGSADE